MAPERIAVARRVRIDPERSEASGLATKLMPTLRAKTLLSAVLGALALLPVAASATPPVPPLLQVAPGAKPSKPAARAPLKKEQGWHFERLGVGISGQGEAGRMEGEQWVHTSHLDESFNYSRSGPVFSVWGLGQILPRLWLGPTVRVMGNYAGNDFEFGFYNELGGIGEWALPVFEKFEFLLTGRANMSLLIPGGDFANEIQRLQRDGASVWNLPRVGWVVGAGAGLRRQMAERFWLRVDASAQTGRLYLFSSSSYVADYRVRKYWSNGMNRWEVGVSAEIAL